MMISLCLWGKLLPYRGLYLFLAVAKLQYLFLGDHGIYMTWSNHVTIISPYTWKAVLKPILLQFLEEECCQYKISRRLVREVCIICYHIPSHGHHFPTTLPEKAIFRLVKNNH